MDKQQPIPTEFEEIELFLLQQMPAKEEEAFLARMSANADLKKRTEEMQLLFLGIQEAALEKKLPVFHKTLRASTNENEIGKYKLLPLKSWLVAASIVSIAALSVWAIWFKNGKEEKLFAQYFQPDPGLISAMGSTDNYVFDRAMIDYKTGNYSAAIKTWDSLQTVHPDNDTLTYFLGSAYLAMEQTGKAIPYLQTITSAKNSVFVKDANWYLALAFIKTGKPKEAIPLLIASEKKEKSEVLKELQN